MAFGYFKLASLIVGLALAEIIVRHDYSGGSNARKQVTFTLAKRSMLVGMSETTEEVCETVIRSNHQPVVGHMINGSAVEILQRSGREFKRTYVQCSAKDRPACHGIKDDKFISECVTVFENANAMVRIINSSGPFRMATIRVPILCECRLRRQYRSFERPRFIDDDDEDDSK